MRRTLLLPLALVIGVVPTFLILACGTEDPEGESAAASEATQAQDEYWQALTELCGQAFPGEVVEDVPGGGSDFEGLPVMHVRVCEEDELQIPFHVGENRSRTWILTRTDDGIRLKHDHRHEDGSEDEVTQYGGDTRGPGTAERQEFHADAYTAELLPEAASNVWAMEIVPGERFTYQLRREGTDRRFRADFDLTAPVDPPPAPWGY